MHTNITIVARQNDTNKLCARSILRLGEKLV